MSFTLVVSLTLQNNASLQDAAKWTPPPIASGTRRWSEVPQRGYYVARVTAIFASSSV